MLKYLMMAACYLIAFCVDSNAQVGGLPDALVMQSGRKITIPADWFSGRRPEIIRLFTAQVYGKLPDVTDFTIRYETLEPETAVIDGKAYRRQVKMIMINKQHTSREINLMLYYPATAKRKPVPVFVFLNYGNHSLVTDTAVKINKNPAGEYLKRGAYGRRFPVEAIINEGCGVITANYEEFIPDDNASFRKLSASFFGLHPDSTGAVSIWAWAHSRLLDFALAQNVFDARHAAVLGHSRLGKAALWTAVNDTRFNYAFINESGNTGAKLSRHFNQNSESIARINRVFPHWFCKKYKAYADQDSLQTLPFDQHWLLACVAPRALYVASAEGDTWSYPSGEFMGIKEAARVYNFLGKRTILPIQMPATGTAVTNGWCGYHIRPGKHDLIAEDWMNFCAFIKNHRQAGN